MELIWVPAGSHTADDLEQLLTADYTQPVIERMPLAEIDAALRAGSMQLFRLLPGPGAVLTRISESNGIKRLSILRGSGTFGIGLRKVLKLLNNYRQELGCECVETVVYSSRFKRALELTGAEVEGYILTYRGGTNG